MQNDFTHNPGCVDHGCKGCRTVVLDPLKLGDKINGTIVAIRPYGREESVILVFRGSAHVDLQPYAVARIPADRHITYWGQGYYYADFTAAVEHWQNFGKD